MTETPLLVPVIINIPPVLSAWLSSFASPRDEFPEAGDCIASIISALIAIVVAILTLAFSRSTLPAEYRISVLIILCFLLCWMLADVIVIYLFHFLERNCVSSNIHMENTGIAAVIIYGLLTLTVAGKILFMLMLIVIRLVSKYIYIYISVPNTNSQFSLRYFNTQKKIYAAAYTVLTALGQSSCSAIY